MTTTSYELRRLRMGNCDDGFGLYLRDEVACEATHTVRGGARVTRQRTLASSSAKVSGDRKKATPRFLRVDVVERCLQGHVLEVGVPSADPRVRGREVEHHGVEQEICVDKPTPKQRD
ncbi:hypothetical protein PF003_g40107 [Phytophthora fragariae]|nr:hypothetical protein PF003_g40107 [Phytophthora fragariae]